MPKIILYAFIVINSVTFIIFGYDKWLAQNKKWRISEKKLLLFSLLGGSIGGIFGILVYRHKVSKKSFLWKFIIIIVLQLFLLYCLNLPYIKKIIG
ncbi:DUF1294 domain-containing protein [Flavobacterium sp.]|uniref:DUF1294 domain-containing protein n=1 Tax=Flavobacterium sp. TaxID=239 RepID=UPI003752F3ED